MNTYYFNNSAWVFSKTITVIGETAFRKLMDNFLCGTKNGSWNDHWLSYDANTLADAKAHFTNEWCK